MVSERVKLDEEDIDVRSFGRGLRGGGASGDASEEVEEVGRRRSGGGGGEAVAVVGVGEGFATDDVRGASPGRDEGG